MTATKGARSTSTGAPHEAHGARSLAVAARASVDGASMGGAALERIPDGGVKPRRADARGRFAAQMASSDPVEIVYERPAAPARRGAIVAGGVVFAVALLWITARALPHPAWLGAAVVITVAVFAAQSLLGGRVVLATRRVTLDHGARALHIEHRRGARAVALADVATVAHGKVIAGDGVALDAVTLGLADGATVVFGVASPEAAEGAARAIRALLGADDASAAGQSA